MSWLALACVTDANAHVTLMQKEASPGSGYRATLMVPHGCAGSATTKLTVDIPEGLIAVKPMPKPGWTVEFVKGPYERTYDFMHGIKFSDGVRKIAWSGRLDDAFYDEFVFSGFVAGSLAAGSSLYFPVVQECERGSENWNQIPAAGQDPHALKSPAPSLRLVANATGPKFRAASLVIDAPWIMATPKGAKVAGGYLTVNNSGTSADRLIGAHIEGAGRVEIHEMTMRDGVMRMRPVPGGLEIFPGTAVELKSGGFHLMGVDLRRAFEAGQTVKGDLVFEKAGSVPVEFSVRAMGESQHRH